MNPAALRFLACSLAGMIFAAEIRAASEPAVRTAPSRPAATYLWPVTKLHGLDYISVRDIAQYYGLKMAWTKSGVSATLSDARGVRLTFLKNQRDFYLDGVRVFLGEAVSFAQNNLWVSKLDVIKNVAPLFRPADHRPMLPAGAPKTIVLDPGHGGTDPGKQNSQFKLDEKDMTLDVAMRLRKLLEARGIRVVMTRTTDKRFSNNPEIDLPLRAELANKESADLFLSIHFNAVDHDTDRVSGVETYVLTPQFQVSTQPEKDKTMREEQYPGNRQDLANALLGYTLHREMITGLKISDRGYKRYRYGVLRTLKCPGALIECGYLSNDAEARRIATPEFRQQIAEMLAEGIQTYGAGLDALRPTSSEPESKGEASSPGKSP